MLIMSPAIQLIEQRSNNTEHRTLNKSNSHFSSVQWRMEANPLCIQINEMIRTVEDNTDAKILKRGTRFQGN